MAIESTLNQQRKYLRCHMKPASFFYYPSSLAVIVLLLIASLVVRYSRPFHLTLPHPEWNTPCGANLLLHYIRPSSVPRNPLRLSGFQREKGILPPFITLHHPSYFLKKLLQI